MSAPRPRPLRNVAIGVGGLGALVIGLVADCGDLAVELGLRPGLADPLERIVLGLFAIAVAVGVVKLGESEVTPLSDPRDVEGRPLVPAGELDVAVGTTDTQVGEIETAAVSVRPPDQT